MIQVKAGKTTLPMNNLYNLIELCDTPREMDTELLGMLLAVGSDRDRLNNNQSRAAPCNLLVEPQLAVRHCAIGSSVAEFDRRKHEPVYQLHIAELESLEHILHGRLLSFIDLKVFCI
jgi:hypothetical protein